MLITVTQRTSNPFKEASEVRGGVTGFLSTLALGPWHVLRIAQPCGGPAVTGRSFPLSGCLAQDPSSWGLVGILLLPHEWASCMAPGLAQLAQ